MRFATISRTIVVVLGLIVGASSAEAQKIYWTNGSVKRANLDGTEVEVIVGSPATSDAVGIAVDVDGGKVYWEGRSPICECPCIQRANLEGTNVEEFILNMVLLPKSC